LIYKNLSLRQVALMRARLLRNWPELASGWDSEVAFFREHGYVVESVTGRRRYLAEENLNEIVNFPIQGGASGIINRATLRLVEAFPFFGPKGPGLANHMHDAMSLELLRRFAAAAADTMTECLTATEPSLSGMIFPAKGKVVMCLH